MSENKIELKPCPFCGRTTMLYIRVKEYLGDCCVYEGHVGCETCGFGLKTDEVYEAWTEAENAAVELWNRRS